MVLAGFGVYLRHGPRCDLEGRENWNRPTPDHQRPGRLPAPLLSLIVSP
jgi:hypothetical protein